MRLIWVKGYGLSSIKPYSRITLCLRCYLGIIFLGGLKHGSMKLIRGCDSMAIYRIGIIYIIGTIVNHNVAAPVEA